MDDAEAERVIAGALDMGYRLVDTAFAYGNEVGVGRGIARSAVDRSEVFLTTKFNAESHSVPGVAQAWQDAVARLGVDYIDLMLIHWPNPGLGQFVEAWEGLIGLQKVGKVRHIGVSNFLPHHLERIINASGVTPAVNQLQINPRYQQRAAREFNQLHGIHTQVWSPLGQGTGLLEIPVFVEIAAEHDCTPAQVILAWDLACGMSTIPKSSSDVRLAENLSASSIRLTSEDIDRIDAVDVAEPDIKHPDSFGH